MENEDEDEYGNDPWDMDKKNKKAPEAKANPFDQKVKLDDLEEDFNPNKKQPVATKKKEPYNSKHSSKEDNGLFVDNDFGDDFEDDEEEIKKNDIFENK